MHKENDLEPQQYERMYREEDAPLEDVRKSALRTLVYAGALLVFMFGIAGAIIRFPEQVEVTFTFRSDQPEQIYRFPFPVYVLGSKVKMGQEVKAGDELMHITSPEIAALVTDYVDAKNNLDLFLNLKISSVEKQREILRTRQQKNRESIATIERDITVLDSLWKSNSERLSFDAQNATRKQQANKKLYEDGVITQFELSDYESSRIGTSDELASTKMNYQKSRSGLLSLREQYTLDNTSLAGELGKLDIDTRLDSAALMNRMQLACNKISSLFGDFRLLGNELVLLAKEPGRVSYYFEGDKEVPLGSILLKIIHRNNRLHAIAKTSPANIGKIKLNSPVTLKVSSFPFYDWGVVRGHVESVSITPDEGGKFSLQIAVDNPRKLKGLLQIGMEGRATILTNEKTIYGYLFSRFRKKYYKVTLQE